MYMYLFWCIPGFRTLKQAAFINKVMDMGSIRSLPTEIVKRQSTVALPKVPRAHLLSELW